MGVQLYYFSRQKDNMYIFYQRQCIKLRVKLMVQYILYLANLGWITKLQLTILKSENYLDNDINYSAAYGS